MDLIARWESSRGAHYVELLRTEAGYKYRANGSGGCLVATAEPAAIGELQAKVDTGYFLPDNAKQPMRRVK